MTIDETKVMHMFADVDEPNKYLNAAHRKRLRFQLGQRDRFLEGYRQSGQYLPMMEEIFARTDCRLNSRGYRSWKALQSQGTLASRGQRHLAVHALNWAPFRAHHRHGR